MDVSVVLIVLLALGLGTASGYLVQSLITKRGLTASRQRSEDIVQDAEGQKKRLLSEGRDEASRIRGSAERDNKDRRSELQRQERRLNNREEQLEQRNEGLEKRERSGNQRDRELDGLRTELENSVQKEREALESVSGLSSTEARDQLFQRAEEDIRHEVAKLYLDVEQQAKDEADEKARRILASSIHRLASEVVSETTTTTVPLPNDEMKGRLIGREGRNIRAIEAATGVDLIIDDTPEAIMVSCFDPVRREVAKIGIAKLVQDGRIHPARIEEVIKKAQQEVEETIMKEGERATIETGVRGMNRNLVQLLGRLKYRYSYGENILQHSMEVGYIAGMLASEIGANAEIAKAGGLLHDIGKALTHEVDGPHAEIGGDVANKNKVPRAVEACIREHHNDDMSSVEAFLVSAADAVSAARPGARRDTLENYVKRLEALEQVATSFPGIERCYAIQAGREVRILVEPDSMDDVAAASLARDVVKKIEDELAYPGQIKVTVIRETRSVEYAK
ncbi:MAG: ribonucrease Y [Chloroflexi bacterium]|jgi:ribonuclease Y|nr:MAG: ribonucrease Y [Chloroflexota bacterium]